MVRTLALNLLLAIAGITDLSVVWLLIFVQAFCWFVFWGLSLFLGNPLQRANCSFVVARLSWCGSKQKLLMKLPSRKTVKGGSSMNSKNWSVSSVLMNRRVWVCGSPFEPFAGESPIIQSRRRVVACSGIAPLLSGKRCKPRVGGVARHQCVELRICKIGRRPVWFSIRQRILDRRVHCARTDKFYFMNKTDLTPRKEFKQAASHSSPSQLTGYESPQRRRFLRELAEEERCSE